VTSSVAHLRAFGLLLVLSVGAVAAGACGSSLSPPGGSGGGPGSGAGGNATGGAVGTAGAAAGGAAGSDPSTICRRLNCEDSGRLCNAVTAACVFCLGDADCHTGMFATANPNTVCLPSGTCGCTADPQCAGQQEGTRCVQSLQQCGCQSDADCFASGALTCAPSHRCGCTSNQDCLGRLGTASTPIPVCDTSTGTCVQCVTDADCTDPNNRVCDPTYRRCGPCRTSTDCAQNSNGPVCQDLGQFDTGIGMCGCNTDQDCVGRAGGPHCVSNGSPYKKCGCVTVDDCAGDPEGSACINPYGDDWMQCGCGTVVPDCPSGKTCVGYACQ
jgi:hypothetical protein